MVDSLAGKIKFKELQKFNLLINTLVSWHWLEGVNVLLDNCAIYLFSGNESVKLRPAEIVRFYKGLQVSEPTGQYRSERILRS